jgi:hypothetical protein
LHFPSVVFVGREAVHIVLGVLFDSGVGVGPPLFEHRSLVDVCVVQMCWREIDLMWGFPQTAVPATG